MKLRGPSAYLIPFVSLILWGGEDLGVILKIKCRTLFLHNNKSLYQIRANWEQF